MRPKTSPRLHKITSTGPQDEPRRPQYGPRRAPWRPKMAQEGPRRDSRGLQKGFQEGLKRGLGNNLAESSLQDPPGTLQGPSRGPSRDPPGPLRGAMSTPISANDSATNFHQLDAPQEAGIVRKGMFITCPQSVFQGGGLRQFGKAKPPRLDSYTCRARVCPSHP